MNKEFEVNGVQYMAVEAPEGWLHKGDIDNGEELLLLAMDIAGPVRRHDIFYKRFPSGEFEIVGLVWDLSMNKRLQIMGRASQSVKIMQLDVFHQESDEDIWLNFALQHDLNDNSLIIKKI